MNLERFNMKIGIVIALVTVAMTSTCVSMSDTTSANTVAINNTTSTFKPPKAISTNYLVAVGPYEVGFIIASPDFFENGYRTKDNSINLDVGGIGDYNLYNTLLTDDNESNMNIFVREFKLSVSENAQDLESETIHMYDSGEYLGHGLNIVKNDLSRYKGIIIDWPSDKTEIIICGTLKSPENWYDIWESVSLKQEASTAGLKAAL